MKLRIAAVQMKFAPSLDANLAKIEAALATAVHDRADVVLFPECATTGYNRDYTGLSHDDARASLESIGKLAARHRVNILIGSPVFRRGRWQNCLVVFDRRGRVVHCYAKCQLTERDRRFFTPGNSVALFKLDGIPCTAIICHERRYPELVRLAVMAGARIVFHPNAGLDSLAASRRKRGGRDGVAVRAFENAVFYVFANSVGPQGNELWSAGDSKIVAPDNRVLAIANNRDEAIITADLDLAQATGKYADDSLAHPRFLKADWQRMLRKVRAQAKGNCSLE
ncbi:MAG: carbon-nitrogen hydrolase family protein [Limisphaerales bacterium]